MMMNAISIMHFSNLFIGFPISVKIFKGQYFNKYKLLRHKVFVFLLLVFHSWKYAKNYALREKLSQKKANLFATILLDIQRCPFQLAKTNKVEIS